jgi:hypothetical protein
MTGTLNIVHGDSRSTLIQYQNTIGPAGETVVVDLTSSTVVCRVATTPTTTTLTGTVVDGPRGEVSIGFGGLPVGGYLAELMRSDISGSQTSDQFHISVRNPL